MQKTKIFLQQQQQQQQQLQQQQQQKAKENQSKLSSVKKYLVEHLIKVMTLG